MCSVWTAWLLFGCFVRFRVSECGVKEHAGHLLNVRTRLFLVSLAGALRQLVPTCATGGLSQCLGSFTFARQVCDDRLPCGLHSIDIQSPSICKDMRCSCLACTTTSYVMTHGETYESLRQVTVLQYQHHRN